MEYTYTYPCSICLVAPCCTEYCKRRLEYINMVADVWSLMSVDQKNEVYNSIPKDVMKILDLCIQTNSRYSLNFHHH